jgi:hypothetical protein
MLYSLWGLLAVLGGLFVSVMVTGAIITGSVLLAVAAIGAWRVFRRGRRPAGHVRVADGRITVTLGRRRRKPLELPLAGLTEVIVDPHGIETRGDRLHFPVTAAAGEQRFLFARHAGTALPNPQKSPAPNVALRYAGPGDAGLILAVQDPQAAANLFAGRARVRAVPDAGIRVAPVAADEIVVAGLGRVVLTTLQRVALVTVMTLAVVSYFAGKILVRSGHPEGRWLFLLTIAGIGVFVVFHRARGLRRGWRRR